MLAFFGVKSPAKSHSKRVILYPQSASLSLSPPNAGPKVAQVYPILDHYYWLVASSVRAVVGRNRSRDGYQRIGMAQEQPSKSTDCHAGISRVADDRDPVESGRGQCILM